MKTSGLLALAFAALAAAQLPGGPGPVEHSQPGGLMSSASGYPTSAPAAATSAGAYPTSAPAAESTPCPHKHHHHHASGPVTPVPESTPAAMSSMAMGSEPAAESSPCPGEESTPPAAASTSEPECPCRTRKHHHTASPVAPYPTFSTAVNSSGPYPTGGIGASTTGSSPPVATGAAARNAFPGLVAVAGALAFAVTL